MKSLIVVPASECVDTVRSYMDLALGQSWPETYAIITALEGETCDVLYVPYSLGHKHHRALLQSIPPNCRVVMGLPKGGMDV